MMKTTKVVSMESVPFIIKDNRNSNEIIDNEYITENLISLDKYSECTNENLTYLNKKQLSIYSKYLQDEMNKIRKTNHINNNLIGLYTFTDNSCYMLYE